MKTSHTPQRNEARSAKPGRDHWWWRPSRLKRALEGNPQLDYYFHWKLKGRKSPRGVKWTRDQRLSIEISLWLYELDARISHRYLFRQPAYRLSAKNLDSVVDFANPAHAPLPTSAAERRRRAFSWAWIEFFDRRDEKKAKKLTRAELNGIIAAMKYCVEFFLHG